MADGSVAAVVSCCPLDTHVGGWVDGWVDGAGENERK